MKIKIGSYYVIIDDEDIVKVTRHKWQVVLGDRERIYFHTLIGKNQTYLHQLLFPGYASVDHKDGNTLDCRKQNLRPANKSQQALNSVKRNDCSSKFKGVSKKGEKWEANITKDNHRNYLGLFSSEEDAARAYDRKALELDPEFARLNFPK